MCTLVIHLKAKRKRRKSVSWREETTLVNKRSCAKSAVAPTSLPWLRESSASRSTESEYIIFHTHYPHPISLLPLCVCVCTVHCTLLAFYRSISARHETNPSALLQSCMSLISRLSQERKKKKVKEMIEFRSTQSSRVGGAWGDCATMPSW